MLSIQNLHAEVDNKKVLKGLNLEVPAGEVHAIMGPNGAGKSTLGNIIAGKDGYDVTDGEVNFHGQSILDLEVDERANSGIFLAMQYPVEIPGVNSAQFLKASINAKRKHEGKEELDAVSFLKTVRKAMQDLDMKEDFLKRSVNSGFSGGEKKRYEILQMTLLEPTLCVLDETDSGLDIDALRIVAEGVNRLRSEGRSMLVITHYQRLLDYIVPDKVHVLADGQIVKSGGKELALELEKDGYATVKSA